MLLVEEIEGFVISVCGFYIADAVLLRKKTAALLPRQRHFVLSPIFPLLSSSRAPSLILPLQFPEKPFNLVPVRRKELLAVQKHIDHPPGLGAPLGYVAPFVRRGAVHAHVPAAHDATLARVEGELEFAFEYDAVVDGHCAVERGFEARAEIYHSNDAAGFDVQTWL